MDEIIQVQPDNQIELTADIVVAYVSNNSVPPAGLLALIASVHGGLVGLRTPKEPAKAEVEKSTTAQVRKSITQDGLVSFVDGKTYKTLKRHLTRAGLDPVSYRERYGLPADYPMTSPAYSAQRSAMARDIGFGQKRRTGTEAMEKVAPEKAKNAPGRPRKTAGADAAEQQG